MNLVNSSDYVLESYAVPSALARFSYFLVVSGE